MTTCSTPSWPPRAGPEPIPPTPSWPSAPPQPVLAPRRAGGSGAQGRREIGLRVLVGRRVATASTTRTDLPTLRTLAEDAVAAARLLPEDRLGRARRAGRARRGLARSRSGRCRASPRSTALAGRGGDAEDAARAVPGITNSDGASASWSDSRVTLGRQQRLSRRLRTHPARRWASPCLPAAGTGMQRDYEYRQATHRADLPRLPSIGREAGERAARRVGPRKVATTQVPVVYAPRAAAGLLRHLAGAIGGDASRQRPQLPEGTAGPAGVRARASPSPTIRCAGAVSPRARSTARVSPAPPAS